MFLDIHRIDSKLRTFAKLKTAIGLENYLISCQRLEIRTSISKFTLLNHDLMIERGRYLGIDKSERFCPFWPNLIETEDPFLLQCATFNTLRMDHLIFKLENINPNFAFLSDTDKFIFSLTHEDALQYVGQFLYKAFYLCEKHKIKFYKVAFFSKIILLMPFFLSWYS